MNSRGIKNIDFDCLSKDQSRLFNNIAEEIISEYHAIIEHVSASNLDNIYWWVSNISSRNYHESDLFLILVKIAFIENVMNQKIEFSCVLVNDMYEKKIFQCVFGDLISIKIKKQNLKQRIKQSIIFRVYMFIKLILNILKFWINAKLFDSLTLQDLKQEKLNIIQVFALPNSFNSDGFKDRYFGGLFDQIKEKVNGSLFYMINIISVKQFKLYLKKVSQAKDTFIIPISWISFIDIIWVCMYGVFLRSVKIKNVMFKERNIDYIIKILIKKSIYNQASYSGLIKSCFIRSIKKKGVDLHWCLSWFENQSHDKGFYFALNRQYKDCISIGYVGSFFHNYYFCLSPTKTEYNHTVLPSQIAIFGKRVTSIVNRFNKFDNLVVYPTFRMNGVWKYHLKVADKIQNILVGLPILQIESSYILGEIQKFNKNFNDMGIQFSIKFHPAHSTKYKEQFNELEIVEGDFSDMVYSNDAFIGLAGCTPMEALALNIPTIILTDPSKGLFLNPFPKDIDKRLYKVCFTADDLYLAISEFNTRTQEEKDTCKHLAHDIRAGYFEPFTDSFSLMA